MYGARQLNAMVAEVVGRLAQNAEAVCQHYLFNGCRTGRYWHVGDVANTPGQSLYVRLSGPRAGKWIDAATGDHGDLLDLIALNRDLPSFRDALDEACRFLALPQEHRLEPQPLRTARDALEMPRRMFASGRPIAGTIAEAYLRNRGIRIEAHGLTALRFHPTCFYRANDTAPREARPALIAAVTDLKGRITGVERTWLDPSGSGKAAIPMPRRALGSLLGNGVRFGGAGKALLVGEGLETVLSLKSVMPTMPMVAALSASRLAGLALPSGLERLYVACDRDAAGWRALERISRLALVERFAVLPLRPAHGDFNDDLRANGPDALRRALRAQIAREDLALLALLE